jgi:hypothetical protein
LVKFALTISAPRSVLVLRRLVPEPQLDRIDVEKALHIFDLLVSPMPV